MQDRDWKCNVLVTVTLNINLVPFSYSMHTVTVRPNVAVSMNGPASVGDVAIFNCTASEGIPSDYSFMWFNGSAEVISSESVHIFEGDGNTSMLMFMVGPDDFVNYTCSVNNTFTEASDTVVLMESREWSCHNDILRQTMQSMH